MWDAALVTPAAWSTAVCRSVSAAVATASAAKRQRSGWRRGRKMAAAARGHSAANRGSACSVPCPLDGVPPGQEQGDQEKGGCGGDESQDDEPLLLRPGLVQRGVDLVELVAGGLALGRDGRQGDGLRLADAGGGEPARGQALLLGRQIDPRRPDLSRRVLNRLDQGVVLESLLVGLAEGGAGDVACPSHGPRLVQQGRRRRDMALQAVVANGRRGGRACGRGGACLGKRGGSARQDEADQGEQRRETPGTCLRAVLGEAQRLFNPRPPARPGRSTAA